MLYQERMAASMRHSVSESASERFSSLVHAHEAVQPLPSGEADRVANREMVESLRQAALKSFEIFSCDPMLLAEDSETQEIFDSLGVYVTSWQKGNLSLAQLIDTMNETLATGALQADVALCERFISVHNIFSLLQLKQIQMQATQSLASAMSHTSHR